ncbi:MAG: glycosyltransferase family 2 protein, partial [Thermoguttaceae bacterium]
MNEKSVSERSRPVDALISVVLPVYNEAEILPLLTARISQAFLNCRLNYEIIYVNDGSNDGSPEILDQLASTGEYVKVVHLSRNFGHQAALYAGLAHAKGDALVIMDSDLQDSPEAIPQMIDLWLSGNDVVYAMRRNRKENPLKKFLFTSFHALLSRV